MELTLDLSGFQPDRGWDEFLHGERGEVTKDLLRRGHILAALARAEVGKDTGRLAASINVTYHPGIIPEVWVGSDLDYAYFVHEGTRPHEMIAAPGEAYRFVIRGRVVYAQDVHHPGTDAQKFLSRHLHRILSD